MHKGTQTYAKTAQATGNPRELESQLLLRAAAQLQAVKNGEVSAENGILSAIRYNRRLWVYLAGVVAQPENPLPREIRQNVASLGNFVVNHSMKLEFNLAAAPEKLGPLININREIAAGLRANAA